MAAKVKSGRIGRIFCTYAREREKKSVFVERSEKDASGASGKENWAGEGKFQAAVNSEV